MSFFWNKPKNDNNREKCLNSIEYDTILRRLSEIDSRIRTIASANEILETNVANLRGKFNQRLSKIADEEKKVEEPKEINSGEIYLG